MINATRHNLSYVGSQTIMIRRTLSRVTTGDGGRPPSDAPGPVHRTEITAAADVRLVSASCTCGWSEVIDYARPTGAPVARRLAGIKARLHEQNPGPTVVAAKLVRDDRTWWYLGFHNRMSTRRLRVWRVDPGRLVAVVTERTSDPGTSVTNAAEMVTAQLAAEYPDEVIEVIEHYPADSLDGEHFDGVEIVDGTPRWWRIPTPDLTTRLGAGLLDDREAGA